MAEFEENRGNAGDILEHDLGIRSACVRLECELSGWHCQRLQIEIDDHRRFIRALLALNIRVIKEPSPARKTPAIFRGVFEDPLAV
jgi:hypothetical protein